MKKRKRRNMRSKITKALLALVFASMVYVGIPANTTQAAPTESKFAAAQTTLAEGSARLWPRRHIRRRIRRHRRWIRRHRRF